MTFSALCNTSPLPVHLDAAGHVLGAGEYGVGDTDDAHTAALIDRGDVVVLEQPDEVPAAGLIDESARLVLEQVAELRAATKTRTTRRAPASADTPTED